MIDLKTTLKPGDLFVSYWLADRLMIAFGDHEEIKDTNFIDLGDLVSLMGKFEQQVTSLEYYSNFINPKMRPAEWSKPLKASLSLNEICTQLRALLISTRLSETYGEGGFRRLVVFPDNILNSLPIHLLLGNNQPEEALLDGAVYAPSASAYVYCCRKRQTESPKQAMVVVGNKNDFQLLWEAEQIVENLPCPAEIVTTMAEVEKLAPSSDIVYVATHGSSPQTPQIGGGATSQETEWQLLFDDSRITPRDFFSGQIKLKRGSVVILSACNAGNLIPGEAHELVGLVRSVFYAGAATVLAARWPVLVSTAVNVFANTIKYVFEKNHSFGSGMNQAIVDASARDDLRELMAGPDASIFFWGAFAVFGCGD